jgi:ubiquinone/menaquinone biosynthesis C-methylase UbiE
LEVIWPLSIYRFLKLIEQIELEKNVLDCGAGGPQPPLALFHDYGYETYGFDISESAITASKKFARERGMELNIIKGDMCEIPFGEASFSFLFSQNSLCHLTKKDTMTAIREMVRVLKPGGYMLVDFMSTESSYYGSASLGEEVGVGEYQYIDDDGNTVLHCFHDDDEPNKYFTKMKVVQRVKTISENLIEPALNVDVRIEYYATKPV